MMKKMDPKVKALWVADLIEHRDKQCYGALHCQDRFCPLGRLVEVMNFDKWTNAAVPYRYKLQKSGEMIALPKKLRKQVGLSKEAQRHIVLMNDTGRMPFPQIAEWIEENL